MRTYEGEVVLCEPTIDAREATCAEIQERTGAHFVHPYNDPYVISGQVHSPLNFLQVGTLVQISEAGFARAVTWSLYEYWLYLYTTSHTTQRERRGVSGKKQIHSSESLKALPGAPGRTFWST